MAVSKRILRNSLLFDKINAVKNEFHDYAYNTLLEVLNTNLNTKTRELLMFGQVSMIFSQIIKPEYRDKFDGKPKYYDDYLILYSFGFKDIPIYWDRIKDRHQEYSEKIRILAKDFEQPKKILNPYNFETTSEYEKVVSRVIDWRIERNIDKHKFKEIMSSMDCRKKELNL
jgi:hypothetical protein